MKLVEKIRTHIRRQAVIGLAPWQMNRIENRGAAVGLAEIAQWVGVAESTLRRAYKADPAVRGCIRVSMGQGKIKGRYWATPGDLHELQGILLERSAARESRRQNALARTRGPGPKRRVQSTFASGRKASS